MVGPPISAARVGLLQACEALVAESVKRWRREEDVVDDTTCVVLFLNSHGDVATGTISTTDRSDVPPGSSVPSGGGHRTSVGDVPTVNPFITAGVGNLAASQRLL